jgi:hypothetical protein
VQPQLRNPIAVDEYLVHVGISSRVDANCCESTSIRILINTFIVLLQIDKLDSSSPLPPSVASIRHEERRVLESAKIRSRSFNDDPAVPVPITPKTNILMIAPNQDIQCMAYDVWDIIEDLLNDGDHPDHAVFRYSPEFESESGNRLYSELWTGEWWHRQQISVGLGNNIVALIPYIAETPITFNGRNMHPVYVSLGNIHIDFRLFWGVGNYVFECQTLRTEISRPANDFLDSFRTSK